MHLWGIGRSLNIYRFLLFVKEVVEDEQSVDDFCRFYYVRVRPYR